MKVPFWSSRNLTRPSRPLEPGPPSRSTYDLNDEEVRALKDVHRLEQSKGRIFLSRSTAKGKQFFEFIVQMEHMYSVFRTDDEQQAKLVFDHIAPIIWTLSPELSGNDREAFRQQMDKLFKSKWPEPDTKPTTFSGYLPVHVAADIGLVGMFNAAKHANFVKNIDSVVRPERHTPLMIAIINKDVTTFQAIMKLKPDLTVRGYRHSTALHYAAWCSRPIILKEMLRVIRTHDQKYELLRATTRYGATPLHFAAHEQAYKNIESLLLFGLPIDSFILRRTFKKLSRSEMVRSVSNISIPSTQSLSSDEEAASRANADTKSPSNSMSRMSFDATGEDVKVLRFDLAMLEGIDMGEVHHGGTPLHWCRNRDMLLKMIRYKEFSIYETNFEKETCVHVYTRKCRLDCLFYVLPLAKDDLTLVNTRAKQNYSAMHTALRIMNGGLPELKCLIAFDSAVNELIDEAQGSPRHLLSQVVGQLSKLVAMKKIKPSIERLEQIAQHKLYCLENVGARRCDPERSDCTEWCSPAGTFNGVPDPQWKSHIDDSQLNYPFMMDSLVDDFIMRKWGIGCMRDPKSAERVNILSCDGGGTKGVVTVQILIDIERRLNKPLYYYFKWMSGTSTGSFIAASIALHRSLYDLRVDYCTMKDTLLQGAKPYPSGPIEMFLSEIFGDTKMRDITEHKLLIPAALLDRCPAQLFLFRSYPSYFEIIDGPAGAKDVHDRMNILDSDKSEPSKALLSYACRASAAAPMFFSACGPFVDGGLIANNPTLDVITDLTMTNAALRFKGRLEEIEQLGCVVACGTGRWPIRDDEIVEFDAGFSLNTLYNNLRKHQKVTTQLAIVATQSDNYVVDRAQSWCASMAVPYFRLSPPLSEQLPLDATDDLDMVNMLWEAKTYCYKQTKNFDKLALLLDGPTAKTVVLKLEVPQKVRQKAEVAQELTRVESASSS